MRRRLPHILLNTATAASLVLCMVSLLAWPLSYFRAPAVEYLGSWAATPTCSDLRVKATAGSVHLMTSRWEIAQVPGWREAAQVWSPQVKPGPSIGLLALDRDERSAATVVTNLWAVRFHTETLRRSPWPNLQFTARHRDASLPIWCVAAAAAALPTVRLTRRIRTRRRLSGKCCPACGYDLRATPTRCPECGHPPTAPGPGARA